MEVFLSALTVVINDSVSLICKHVGAQVFEMGEMNLCCLARRKVN